MEVEKVFALKVEGNLYVRDSQYKWVDYGNSEEYLEYDIEFIASLEETYEQSIKHTKNSKETIILNKI